jgi:hypothetical protein
MRDAPRGLRRIKAACEQSEEDGEGEGGTGLIDSIAVQATV